jgi:hypothetical protein
MATFAWTLSTLTLVVSAVAMLGLMQSEGGLIDSCYSFSFFDISVEKCREIGASIVKGGTVSASYARSHRTSCLRHTCACADAG